MSYLFGEDRTQAAISTLEDGIASDNSVRLIDLLVDKLYLEGLKQFTKKGKSHTGRPAYHPRDMMKLFVYGYMNRISSSRRLETECNRNIELKWLLRGLAPDFKTIADFRKDNADSIKEMSLKFRFLLSRQGLITGELMAIDGTKLKANAGAKELSREDLESELQNLENEIERYFNLLQYNDLEDELHTIDTDKLNTIDLIASKIKELEAKKTQYEALHTQACQTKRQKVNPTDPDSRMMHGRKESFSGYNIQIIVDSLFKLIASAQVRQGLNDRQEMIPALDDLKESLDVVPQILLADNGYDNVSALQTIEAEGKTEALVMIGETASVADSHNKWAFRYDNENDCYYCPMGQVLKRRGGIQQRKGRQAVLYQCKQSICDKCEHRTKCTKSKDGRSITRYTDESWVESYRAKVHSPRAKALLRKRKAIVEHIFGVLKCWMGKIPLLMRGKKKVQIEIDLYSTSYNLKRLIKILGFDKVKSMLMAQRAEREGLFPLFLSLIMPVGWFFPKNTTFHLAEKYQ